MLFVGIDAASDKHDASIISKGKVLSKLTFPNNPAGFKKLHTEIQSHTESLDVYIGMENTGIYHSNLANFLFSKGYMVFTINANLIFNYSKSLSPRLTKTDNKDALTISKFISDRYHDLIPYTPKVYINDELKSLSRLRFNKQSNLSKYKTELKRLLMMAFPEFVKHFDPFSKWALTLLSNYESTDKIARMHTSTLTKVLKTRGDRSHKAKFLKELASTTVGQNSLPMSFEIRTCISDILHFQSQINDIESHLKTLMDDFKHITSIPGVGLINGALIIGEIGDVFRFEHKSKLLAFAGCDASIYQSGKYEGRGYITKRGSKYLRTGLYRAAIIASISPKIKDNKFRDKYLTKVNQGKHHNSAIFHVAKNILNTIYTQLKTGEYFDNSIR